MGKTEVDVCIISYAKTEELYETTCKGIKSLLASEKDIHFNVYAVESNLNRCYDQFEQVTTMYPYKEFNYNLYLNYAVQFGLSEYVVLCNNDLIYEKEWASKIINCMNKAGDILLSCSPFCPETQAKADWSEKDIYYGYRIRRELAGWCIFQKRKIYEIIGELNTDVDFWFSDDIYAEQLKKHGIGHALIPASVVHHHDKNLGTTGQSTLTEFEKNIYTTGQHEKFLKAKEKLWKHL